MPLETAKVRAALLQGSFLDANRRNRLRPAMGMGGALLLAVAAPAFGQSAPLPTGGAFTAGSGTIQSAGNAMSITQASQRGVIDWQDFSIAAEHQVLIDNAAGATLNRVMSGQLSRIEGMLTATGSVYLMNPTGVIVGPKGVVTTGGDFVATTRQIDPAQFMGGGALAVAGTSNGGIVNQGSVVSQGGSVVMIAREITNSGTIRAAQGRVDLAAANEVLLATTDGKADGIYVAAGSGGGDVTQDGWIEAAAVALKAANGNIFALAGNRDGLVQATGTATIDGELWLTAPEGTVEVAGKLAARNADGSGGHVLVNGHEVALAGTADIAAAGTRGGEVLVGTSGYATGDDLAARTTIADSATIVAGGPEGGGLIETSGKEVDVDVATILTSGGEWLIDPVDITIDTAMASSLVTSLGSGDVTVTTNQTGSDAGDLTVAAPVVWASSFGLTLDAVNNLAVNAQVAGSNGEVTLIAGGDASIAAAVSGSSVTATVADATTIAAAGLISATAGDITLTTGTFANQSGAGALTASGNWLVYSGDPASDTPGELTPDFYQYDASAGTAPAAVGNGLLYSIAPTVNISLGNVIKDYDGTTEAFLDDTNTTVTGLINGDEWTLEGVYATKDAGTGITVTADNFEASNGGIPVFGYDTNTPVTAATGTINRAELTALIVGNPTKTYNATTDVSLTSANFQLLGVADGESITVNAAATAAYAAPDAGVRQVDATFSTPNFTAGSGTLLTNYVLPTSATGLGLINQASLIVSGLTADNKVYDSTTDAVINTSNLSIFGVVTGDTVNIDASGAVGNFIQEDVGNAIAVTASGFVLTGADAANYTVDQPEGLAANITPASLLVSGLVANDKIYDGTTTASLNTAGVQFTGLIAGDDVTPSGAGAQINFATKNAGTDIPVTIAGLSLSGSDAGNYNISYSGSLAADILQRQLTFDFSGMPTKVYDGTTNAVVDGGGIQLGNIVSGESITISQAADVNYASKNVGAWDITGTLTPADYQAGPNTLLSNYVLPTTVSGPGEITPAPLTIVIVNDPTKPYDGNADASLGPENFAVSGFVFGEGASVTESEGQYASSDAGTWTVTVELDANDFDADPGTMMSNYMIPSPVYGPGTITRIPLGPGVVTVDITGNPSKIYDGTVIATLVPDDYTLGGFLPGEGATITETEGTYDSKDAGFRAVLVLLDPTDFDPDPGTNLNNYILPTQATGVGTIFQRTLSASIINDPTKVYNGTTRAVVGPSDYLITGTIAGESVTVAPGVVASYDLADAGARTITANFTAQSNFTAGAGTLLANYILPTMAEGPGTITPAPLVVLGVTAQNKVYDQNTVATLTGTASLFGVIAGDTVNLDGGSATGEFATPNVGTGIEVTVSGYDISGADSANYELFQPSGLAANITPLGLVIAGISADDKIYDGTTVATLSGGTLTGAFAGEDVTLDSSGATAAFLQKNVGTDIRVNVSGFALSGADAGNYSISQPSGLTADIFVRQLFGTVIGNPTKTYDGTTTANLTSANYSLTGFVAGEGGSITQSSAANYASADAGTWTIEADLVVSDFTANPGTLLSNYLLPNEISGSGTINPAQLIASIINNPTKVYDATTVATLTSSNFLLQGFVGGEGATVTQTVGEYDTKNAGSRTVTADLAESNYTGTGTTNLDNYILPTEASGAGTITQAELQVINIAALDKEYDGNTSATLTGGALDNVLGSDTVNLVTSGVTGQFEDKNVGVDKEVTATGYTISGADAANYTLTQPDVVLADIFAKEISLASVTKTYDAGRLVPTVGSAYTLNGVVAGDSVSVDASGIVNGFYDDKNVGTGKIVNIESGVALTGSDAGNYIIDDFVTDAAIGIINRATLTVEGVTATDRQYNQTLTVVVSGGTLTGVLTDQDTSILDDVSFVTPTPTSGTMANANVGANKPVTVTGFQIQGGDADNYNLVQPDDVTVNITPAPITLIRVEKIYDGTGALPTDSTGYGYTGIFAGDVVTTSSASATGGYLGPAFNVGGTVEGDGTVTGGLAVSVDGLVLGGTHGMNYVVTDVTNQPIGVITPKALTASIINDPTKIYDTTTLATLGTGNFLLEGFVAGEGADVTVTQTVGAYDLKDAGSRTVTALLDETADFASTSTLLSNYALPTEASGAGTIEQAPLLVINVNAGDKIYDGNAVAVLTGGALDNVLGADDVTLQTGGAVGTFVDALGDPIADVGTWDVTALGYTISGADAHNYALQQPALLSATISAAALTLTEVFRIYDGTTDLPTVNSAYVLDGIVAGDVVFVDGAVAAGGVTSAYTDKDVATGIGVTIDTLQLTGADASNYTVSMAGPNIGTITPRDLVVTIADQTKIYDGNATAVLTAGDYTLSGFALGENATITQTMGAYNTKDVLTATTVTADIDGFIQGVPLSGFDINNYNVALTAQGNGTITPATVTVTLADQTKIYDGNTTAVLTTADYTLSGFVAGEGATITQATGAYNSPNVIGATQVTATISGQFSATGTTDLSNYTLPGTVIGLGTITPRAITAAIIGNPTKVYDGNRDAELTSANYQLTGFVGTQGATVSQTAGTYALKDAGTRLVTAILDPATHFTATGGAILSNYDLPVIATGNGTIEQALLAVAIIGNPSKIYDGNTDATLTSANYQFTGFVAGEGATVSQTFGTYNSKDVVTADTVTADIDGFVTGTGTTLLSNYVLPTEAIGAGAITQALLAAAIIGNPTKVYDGNTDAALTSANYQLTGFVAGEGATVSQTLGTYNTKDVLTADTVTADIGGFIVADAGTLLSNYALPTSASGDGTITAAMLTAAIVGLPTKDYDATTDATLTGANFELDGFVAGEGASVTQTEGLYASPDAGIRALSADLAETDFDANLGTDLTNYILPTSAAGFGVIERLQLIAAIINDPTKTYDGTIDATLTPTNFQLTGFVAGQGATVTETVGDYASANAGTWTVTAALGSPDFVANSGTSLLNYILPTSAEGPGTISRALLTAAIIGNPSKVYDGTTAATLTPANYSLTGFIAGEGATVTETVGVYNSPNVGSRTVTATLAAGDFTANSGTLLANYVLPTSASGAGTITQALLTAAIIGNPSKVYDGNTAATLTSANYSLTGFVAGEGATVTQTVGTYSLKDVGSRTVTATLAAGDFTANTGTLLSNYVLPTSASGLGTITRALLTAAIIGNPSKVYDGNTAATLTSANYSLTGFVAGEGATVTETVGTYASKDAGLRTVTATLAAGDFTANSGTLLSNYTLPTTASGLGTITQALLTAAIIGNPSKVYDGNTAATLTSANYSLTGFIAGEGATVTETVGTYSLKDVGSRTVTATLAAGDFIANSGTLLANYVLPTSASGTGTITQALLTAAIIGNPSKVYDGNTDATLTSANYQLSGFVAGEGATVSQTFGTYNSKDVVTANTVTADIDGFITANSGTLLSNYILPTEASGAGTITQALLTAAIIGNPSKVYDGNTDAALTSANFQLTGFVTGEGATVSQTFGTYNSKDVVTANTVTADIDGFIVADTGTLLSNYALPTEASGAGTITQALLTAAIIGNPSKVYDGNTDATLTSANYSLTGFVAGEGATVTETAGTYSLKDVGSRTVTATLAAGDFAADGGTLLANYVLPTSASGLGTINQALLTAAIIGNPSKVYDGNTDATLTSANFGLSGFVAGEGATVTQTAGTYNSKDVVTANTVTADIDGFITANSGTLLSNYVLPTEASGAGTITRALLSAAIIGNPSKVYDGDADAALTGANYSLTGFIAGESATVTQTAGTYNSKDVVTADTVTAQIDGFIVAGTGTLLSNYALPGEASGAGAITPALLTAAIIGNPSKVYDGTTDATLVTANYQLTGFIAGEGATVNQTEGTYSLKDVGPRLVTTTLAEGNFDPTGTTLLSNYTLPTSASGMGTITQAMLTAAIIGNPSKVYDGNTDAALTSANYSLTGFAAGEGATVSQTAGTYNSKDVVTADTVTADIDGFIAADSGTLLSNYILPTEASGAGTITRALLTAAIIGNPSKVYDGNTDATLTSANYSLTGFIAGEGATVTETAGIYGSPNAGSRTVTATLAAGDFSANTGTLLSNYVLPTTASGLGTITRALLTAAIIGNPSKIYDGTTTATLTSANYSLTGFVAGEGATVTETAGVYGSPNAGSRTVTATLAAGDFSADTGTLLSNYILPTTASGAGTITQALLTAAIIGNPTKVYDGNTTATLTSANYSLTGFVAGEGATVSQTFGTYNSKNVLTADTVTADIDGFITANSGTLLSNYVLPTSASGAGSITQAMLTAAIIGNPTKVYDGDTDATLTGANYSLTGFVAGEGATVTETAGTYDSADAGERMLSALLGEDDFTAHTGTLLSNYVLPTEALGPGTINPALLTAAIIGNPTRAYDGTTIAALTSGNYLLSGFIDGEGATVTQTVGSYNSKDVTTANTVTADIDGFITGDSGTLLSNYILPTDASGAGTITQALLTAAIIGNPGKVYDGTTDAALTSADYQFTGFIAGEGATVTQTAGTYNSKDVVTANIVTADIDGFIVADGGTLLSNYALPTSASGAGTIDPKAIGLVVPDIISKIYDGTTDAEVQAGQILVVGLIGDENISVRGTIEGAYPDTPVGIYQLSIGPGNARLVAAPGTQLSNYVLQTGVIAAGEITPAPLTAALIDILRSYDGTNIAALTPANFQLSGFVAGEGASVIQTLGQFASRNAGQWTVTAALEATDFTASSGTLLSNYILPDTATGLGTINPLVLTASIIGDPTKVYDGSTFAALTSANYLLNGFITGEGATVTQTAGSYNSKNVVEAGTVTANLDPNAHFTADSGTLLSNYVLPTTAEGPGTITPAPLGVAITGDPTKLYDGNTDATLGPSDYTIDGFIAGEGAIIIETDGSYSSPEAGEHPVTVSLDLSDFDPNDGTDMSNYALPVSATGPGTIEQVVPCVPDIFTCLPDPSVIYGFLSTQQYRFYIVYPTVYPMYQGHTGAFAGMPSVIVPSSVLQTPGGVMVVNGTQMINSSEQILLLGGGSAQFTVHLPPQQPIDLEGVAP